MNRDKKIGVGLIVFGICLPLMALPFISGYSKEKSIFENLYQVGIKIKKENQSDTAIEPAGSPGQGSGKHLDFSRLIPKRIPFRFFLAFTLIFLYAGFVKIERSKRRDVIPSDSKEGQENRTGD
jgi:hypothetical protein